MTSQYMNWLPKSKTDKNLHCFILREMDDKNADVHLNYKEI